MVIFVSSNILLLSGFFYALFFLDNNPKCTVMCIAGRIAILSLPSLVHRRCSSEVISHFLCQCFSNVSDHVIIYLLKCTYYLEPDSLLKVKCYQEPITTNLWTYKMRSNFFKVLSRRNILLCGCFCNGIPSRRDT